MKRIPLTQGKFALVDDGDFEWLNQRKWCVAKWRYKYYAIRSVDCYPMHRILLGLKKYDGHETDHINGNGLDNRRSNIRVCTPAENRRNVKKYLKSSSQYKGVYYSQKDRNWYARIQVNGKKIHLGKQPNEITAAQIYDNAARKYFGEFANTNFKLPEGAGRETRWANMMRP